MTLSGTTDIVKFHYKPARSTWQLPFNMMKITGTGRASELGSLALPADHERRGQHDLVDARLRRGLLSACRAPQVGIFAAFRQRTQSGRR